MFGWIGNVLRSSETVKFEEALGDFDGYLEVNVLAKNAADRLVTNLEEAGYTKSKIKAIVKERLPMIIKLAKKNGQLLDLAQESSDIVVDRNETSDDLSKEIKKEVKDRGSSEEDDGNSAILRELKALKAEMGGKSKKGDDKDLLEELKELLGDKKKAVAAKV